MFCNLSISFLYKKIRSISHIFYVHFFQLTMTLFNLLLWQYIRCVQPHLSREIDSKLTPFFFFLFFFSKHKSLYIEYWSTKILFSPFISFSFQILQEDFSRRNIIQNLKKVVNNDVPLAVKNFNFFQTLSLSVESLIPVPDGHNAECLAYLEDLKCLLRWNKWIWLWTTLSINFWMYIFWTKNVF